MFTTGRNQRMSGRTKPKERKLIKPLILQSKSLIQKLQLSISNRNNFVSKLGYSLIEMGIVLAAVSAITVVAVGGTALVQRSKLTSVINDVQGFTKAVTLFKTRYNGVPGDMVTISSLNRKTSGNGNGSIDSSAEAIQFWQDLAITGFIKGTYNGASLYSPGVSLPAGSMQGSGYNVLKPTDLSLPDQSIIIELAGFTSASNLQPILTPEDAKAIDIKMDDGNPGTGNVRAANDPGCISGSLYNVSNKTVSCRLRFIIGKAQTEASNTLSGSCSQPGAVRRSDDAVCPVGTIGKVIQACQFDADGKNGIWKTTEKNCEAVTCYGGKKYNEQRIVPCSNGFTGVGITQVCSAEGVWITTSSNCNLVSSTESCPTAGASMPPRACGWGSAGAVTESCNAGRWEKVSNCSDIKCSGSVSIGGTTLNPASDKVGRVITNSNTCGQYYTGTTNITCALDGKWQITSDACMPNYGSLPLSCSTGNTQNMGCPPGQTGSNIQTCVTDNKWISTSDTCTPITCSGERVGSVRVANQSCPTGTDGVVFEICGIDGNWETNNSHCSSFCPSTTSPGGDAAGNANWPNAPISANSIISGTCIDGYSASSMPSRICQSSGWSGVTGLPCAKTKCPTTGQNAFWPLTEAPADNIRGRCQWPRYEGWPLSKCVSNGSWSSIGSPCATSRLVSDAGESGITGLQLWLDAADYSTLYSDTSCSSPAIFNKNIGCWRDKSANSGSDFNGGVNNATGNSGPTLISNTINGRNGLLFNGNSLSVGRNLLDSIENDTTVFIVASKNTDQYSTLLSSSNVSWGTPFNIFHYPGNTVVWNFGSSYGNGRLSTQLEDGGTVGTPYIWAFNRAPNSMSIFRNGSLIASQPRSEIFTPDNTSLKIGVYASSAYYYNGKVGEILLYNRTLSTQKLNSVTSYLSNKWAIAISAPASCPTITAADSNSGYATWPTTNVGAPATGICTSGYSGSPTRACNANATWSETITNRCIQNTCQAQTLSNATWPTTNGGVSATGTCISGYAGTPTMACNLDGTWGAVEMPCQRQVNQCQALTLGNVSWPSSPPGYSAEGSCSSGYSISSRYCKILDIDCYQNDPNARMCYGLFNDCKIAFLSRSCNSDGTWSDYTWFGDNLEWYGYKLDDRWFGYKWSDIVTMACERNQCLLITTGDTNSGYATWPTTNGGVSATGTCISGYAGTPSRSCNASGDWGGVTSPCTKHCPAITTGNSSTGYATWPAKPATKFGSAEGACIEGYKKQIGSSRCHPDFYPGCQYPSLTPTRHCNINGEWESIENPCQPSKCPAKTFDDATWPETNAGETAEGTCAIRDSGFPKMVCNTNGTWSNDVKGRRCYTGA